MVRLSSATTFQNLRAKKLIASLSLILILLPLLVTSPHITRGEENGYILNEEFNTLGPEWKRVQAGGPDIAELGIVNGQLQSALRKSPGAIDSQLGVVYEKPISPPAIIELKQSISNITVSEDHVYAGVILTDYFTTARIVHLSPRFLMIRHVANPKLSFFEISYRSDTGEWHWGDAYPPGINLTEVKWRIYWKDVGYFEVYQDVGAGYEKVYEKKISVSFMSAYIYLVHVSYSSKDVCSASWDWIRVYKPAVDVTPPLIEIIRPTDGETIAMGPFPGYNKPLIEVNASDDVGLQRVEYYINPLGRGHPPSGFVANKSIEYPYWNLHSWFTAPIANLVPTNAPRRTFASEPHYYPNGRYVVTVIAYDKAGNSAKDEISVTVDNGLDIVYSKVVEPVRVAKDILAKLGIPMEAYSVVGEAKLLYKPDVPAQGMILAGDKATRLHFFSRTEAEINNMLYNASLGWIYPSSDQLTKIEEIVVGGPVTHTGILKLDKSVYHVGEIVVITLEDPDLNIDPLVLDVADITINSTSDPIGIKVSLIETGVNMGIFTGKVLISESPGLGKIYARPGDTLVVLYRDVADVEGKARNIVAYATVKARESIMEQVPREVYAWQPSIILVQVPSEFKSIELSATIDVNVEVSGINIPDPLPPTTFTIPLLPISHAERWYIASIPGLPAGTYKYLLWSFKISSFVNYDLLLDGVKYASGSYLVKEGIPELKLPPAVIATVYDVIEDPEIIKETHGLGPRGWVKGSDEKMKVLVIAYDDKGLKEVNAQYSINGGLTWTNLPLTSDPLGGVISNMVDTINNAIRSVEDAVRIVKPDFDIPEIYLPMAVYNAELPGQSVGRYVLFRASAIDVDGYSSSSPMGLYYVINKASATKVLIIDPHVSLWLLSQNAKQLLDAFKQFVSYQFPDGFIRDVTPSSKISDVVEKYGIIPFHHWELLGKYYNLYITYPSSEVDELINSLKPDVILLSNLWLGYEGSTFFNWDLEGLGVLTSLIDYVKSNHAGFIATHGTLNDWIIWRDGKVKVGPREHVGDDVPSELDPINEATVASILGMPSLTLYEFVRDRIAYTLYAIPQTHMAGMVVGSIPLQVPYVPFSGKFIAVQRDHPILSGIPVKFEVELPTIYREFGFKAYTAVGWQLSLPVQVANTSWSSAKVVRSLAERAVLRLSYLMENATEKAMKWEEGKNFIKSIDWGLKKIYDSIATSSVTAEGFNVDINIPDVGRFAKSIGADYRKLLQLIPAKLVAISEDNLAGIIAYDKYFDPKGYRSVFFSFEIEAVNDLIAEKLLVNSIEWTRQWKFTPLDFLGLIPVPKELADRFKSEVARIPGEEVLSKEILLNELGFFELPIYARKPAKLHILVAHPTSDKITLKLIEGVANITSISKLADKLTKVEVEAKEAGKFLLGIKADPESSLNPAYVTVKEEAIAIAFTVLTDKTEYKPGDTILVNGSGATPDVIVTLKITDPEGKVVAVDQVTTDANGRFYARFVIPSRIPTGGWTKFGYYKLEATDSATGKTATTEFLIRPVVTLPIQLISVTIVDPMTGEPITPKPGRMCMIRAEMKNVGEVEQPLLYIAQVKDDKDVVIHIGTAETILPPGASIKLGVGWTPSEAKTFTIEIFVWKSFAEPIALMKKHSVTIAVLPS